MLQSVRRLLVPALILFVGVAIGFSFLKRPGNTLSPGEIESIRLGFTEFAAQTIQKDPRRKLEQVEITAIKSQGAGQLVLNYDLVYREKMPGKETLSYAIKAQATMEKLGEDRWEITRVSNQKQALDFQEGIVITK